MQRVEFHFRKKALKVSSVGRFRKEVQVCAGLFLEGAGLDVMLRGSVQSGRFEASERFWKVPEPGSASWL